MRPSFGFRGSTLESGTYGCALALLMVMTGQKSVPIPSGVADPKADVGYIVGKRGQIHSLNLATGELLARTEFAATPLTVADGVLIGWALSKGGADSVSLFAATRQGDLLRPKWEVTLSLPDWVEPRSPEPDALSIAGEIEGTQIAVSWEAHSRYRGGAPPSAAVEEAARHDDGGIIRLDLETGEVLGTEPVDSGTALKQPVVDVTRLSNDPDAQASVTLDGRFAFIHEPGATSPSWQVYSTETGKRIASLPYDPGTDGVAVVNKRVIYTVVEDLGATRRRSLRCRDLQTGNALWSQLLAEQARAVAPPPPP